MIRPFGLKAARFIRRPPQEDARLNILEGSVRSSKTWALNAKLVSMLCGGYWPGGTGLITGVSKTTIKTNILNDVFAILTEKRYRYNQQSGELTLCGRPFLVVGAKDEGSWKYIRGATVGLWIADELTLHPQSFFEMALSRLSLPGSRMYGSTNPGTPYHYLKTQYLDNHELLSRGDLWTEHFTLDDNPNIEEKTKEFLRRLYVGVFKLRYIDGLWVVAEGSIYRDCLSEENYYDDAERPVGLLSRGGHAERWIAIDYGTTNPTVFGDIYDDGTVVWLDREYYWDSQKENRQKTDAEYADDLILGCREQNWPGFGAEQREWPGVIIDPSAASFRAELISRGVFVTDADNDVEDGVRRVSGMLASRRFKMHRRCLNVIREMQTYAWNSKKAGSGKEEPIKAHDHGPDALRYYVNTRINDWRLAA